jgi:hypothetical protein
MLVPSKHENAVKAKRLEIPGSSDFIQLLPYDSFSRPKHFRNLSRCSASGESLWVAELPESPGSNDAYVNAEIKDGRLLAWSWSCFQVELNLQSGAIENSIFTK